MKYSDENHFALFHVIAEAAGSKVFRDLGFQYYYIEGFIWPNLIFGTNLHQEKTLDVLHTIHQKSKKGNIPNLLMCSPPAIPKSGIDCLKKSYKKYGHWTAMFISLEEPIEYKEIENFCIKRASNEKEINEWCELLSTSSPGKYIDRELFYKIAQQNACRFYTGYINNKAVATCWAHHYNDSLGLYAISTDPNFCKKGIASEITKHAMCIAKKEGLSATYLQATEAAISLYCKIGFTKAGKLEVFDLQQKIFE